MTRRPIKSNFFNHYDEACKFTNSKQDLSSLQNGLSNRNISRQSSQELLKVQCNGLPLSHRNSKLLSPSGSDVLPLPSSRRSTRRASASWCGSTQFKKRCLSTCDKLVSSVKRNRAMSANSVHCARKRKKLSPEEKLLQDNKEYFKMEVLTTKLRSTGSLLNLNQNRGSDVNLVRKDSSPVNGLDKKYIFKKITNRRSKKRRKRIKTKNNHLNKFNGSNVLDQRKKNNEIKINGVLKRKKRQSELIKLCNEAESFMFGESSKQCCVTNKVTEKLPEEHSEKNDDTSVLSNKEIISEGGKKDKVFKNECKLKRKRRSHAEAFIHDNLDYYKFETPGSRLRYQGSLPDGKSEDKDFIYTLKQKKKEINVKNDSSENCPLNVESNDKINNCEKKRNFSEPSEEVNKILFSFESIPATEPWYEVYKRQDEGMENYYPLLSNPSDQPFLLPYELPKPIYSKIPFVNDYYKKKRKKLVHLFNHPRKSPRCHASTLAILSSLKKRKRRSGTNISMNSLLCESLPNSQVLPENKSEARCSETENKSVENEEILNFLYNDEPPEVKDNEIFLEPLSDSETTPSKVKDDDDTSCKSIKNEEPETETVKNDFCNKTWTKTDPTDHSENTNNKDGKYFCWQTITPDDFFKDMIIETKKKSGLTDNVLSVFGNYKLCKSMELSDGNLNCGLKDRFATVIPEKIIRRKRKKARKINKTGWDNKKSRRRPCLKLGEVKELDCGKVNEKSVKTKVKIRENGINSENIIRDSKRRSRRDDVVEKRNSNSKDKPVLRSHLEITDNSVCLRRNNRDVDSKSSSGGGGMGLTDQGHPNCVLRIKKGTDPGVNVHMRLRCSTGRRAIQKRRLLINKKKKRVIEYPWGTQKR
ncbi:conserved hypothetical protein [Pediculus humanus corporis]|uniref:Uncharacterized protein n=1 Tax=Pediculus humanus subsp. corporis TaxID=121224 RepID=E0VK55_PEDHC|nr:uncharacterized protein Phum_PHUM257090 [Pediculus humanus corporis]EEB13761.1 conserved hypothetical protein [Pediculus humanus corporis]